MKFFTKTIIAGLILTAGVAFAGKSTDPDAMARQTLMGINGMNAKLLGDMAGGKVPFDAVAAEAARTAIVEVAGKIPATFEPQGTDAESKAKPDIWTNWDDFVAKADALNKAAMAMDTSSVEGIGAGMAGVGGACKDCHTKYQL